MCQIVYVPAVTASLASSAPMTAGCGARVGSGLAGFVCVVALASALLGRPAFADEWARPRIDLAMPPDDPEATSAGPKPARPWSRACSTRHAFCVLSRDTNEQTLLATLTATDRAWETLTQTLGVPPPAGEWGEPWRLFLVDEVEGGGTSRATGRDPLARLDRATSFGMVERATPPGCALDVAVARAVARGSLLASAPATDEGSAVAGTEALARLAGTCATGDEEASTFQANPEITVVDAADPAFERGASAFFDWLDARFASEPGALVSALWALSPTISPFGATKWAAKPTGFDVLRLSLKGALWPDSTLDDVLVRFAVQRALAMPPAHLAWDLPWPAAARRLASPRPTAPTGASLVLVHHDGAPPGAKLRLIAQWEDYGRMRWVVLKLGPSAEPLAQIDVTSADRATRAAIDVEGLDGVDRLLVVGVNLGSIEYPFDPGQGAWVPHGWLLTLETE